MTRLDDMAELAAVARRLERTLVEVFTRARDSIMYDGVTPKPPPAEAAVPADPADLGPTEGFQSPAPPDAPKLEAENYDPATAQAKLRNYGQALRRLSAHLANCAKLTGAIADLLEHGTTNYRRRARARTIPRR